MKTKKDLIQDLEKLSCEYLDLEKSDRHNPMSTIKDCEKYRRISKQSGQMLVDFYDKIFVPNYSALEGESIEEVYSFFSHYSSIARKAIKNDNYFALEVLLIPQGSRVGDPNRLEVLIENLK